MNYDEVVLDQSSPADIPDLDAHYSSLGGHSMATTPVRPHLLQPVDHIDLSGSATPVRPRLPQVRYPPYYPSNYIFPDHVQPARCTSTEKLLSSVVESQKKVMALVEGVSCRITELEKVVTNMNAKSAESVSTSSTEGKKRLPPQLSVS